MKSLILSSNWRARVAILCIRIRGRLPETMAELRDALNQRRNMRMQAHYSLWRFLHEERLQADWRRYCARNRFRLSSGNAETDFEQYAHAEYLKT